MKLRFITGHFMFSLTYEESRQEHQEEINQAGQLHAERRKANEYAQKRLNVVAGRQSCCCQMQTGRTITSISHWLWEDGSSWTSQEIPTFYETQNLIPYPQHPPALPILSQMNPVHTFPLFQINFNIILPPTQWCYKWLLFSRFPWILYWL